MRRLLTLKQFDRIKAFVSIGRQHINLSNDFTIGIDNHVHQVAVVKLPVSAATGIGVGGADGLIAGARILFVAEDFMGQIALT